MSLRLPVMAPRRLIIHASAERLPSRERKLWWRAPTTDTDRDRQGILHTRHQARQRRIRAMCPRSGAMS